MVKKHLTGFLFVSVGIIVGLSIYFFPLMLGLGGDLFKGVTLKEEGEQQIYYTFEYDCELYNIPLTLFESYNDYFSTIKKRVFTLSDMPESKLEEKYYNIFLDNDKDEKILQEVVSIIKNEIWEEEPDEIVVALISFVQNIEYNCDKYFSYELAGEYSVYETNYPYETLFDKKGVCEDSSILLAKLLRQLGYGVALFSYSGEEHMAVGISCPMDYSDYGSGYCFIETTGPSMIGIISKLEGDLELVSTPVIIKVAEGKQFEKIKQIKEEQEDLVDWYTDYILHLGTCEEINLFKELHKSELDINPYEETVEKYEKRWDDVEKSISLSYNSLIYPLDEYERLAKFYDIQYCTIIYTQEKYDSCMRTYNELEEKRMELNKKVDEYNELLYNSDELYEEYERAYDIYAKEIEEHNQKIKYFNGVLSKTHKECSPVTVKSLLDISVGEINAQPINLDLYTETTKINIES